MNWTVSSNNGNSADLEAGPLGTEGRKTVRRPKKMSRDEFFRLAPGTMVDDTTLEHFYGVKPTEPGRQGGK